jgi:pimeloyl-ACP methyl ester carboxylesterase
MKNALVVLTLFAAAAAPLFAADAPSPDAFRVLPPVTGEAPTITPYLKYQADMAWREDEERVKEWAQIRTEADLNRSQQKMQQSLLAMLGGLPDQRTPLNARITGKIPMDGFHIEKLIYESLPGVYVTALVYVPEDGKTIHPGVLVPAGHSTNGKNHYQVLCQRLVHHGYVVIAWDPVGQGERSQFWDAKSGKSRYNLICAEHAVMGNLAYLAGTNLARWEIWDGIRAVDYLLTRPDVDPQRINITGTSGGGFQVAHIAALDKRIKAAAPSCYITALPMRVYNRIFKDPDSDPEQDLYGMISNHVDNPGLLLMMYPRPVFVAAAVLDFFPIEGAHRSVREVSEIYAKFNHADRIAMAEGYHDHQFSPQNQEAAVAFLDHFNNLQTPKDKFEPKELDDKTVQVTRTGQVMLDFEDARSMMDVIREYYENHKKEPSKTVKQLYYSSLRPEIDRWKVAQFDGSVTGVDEIRWESVGTSSVGDVTVDKYLLHHSHYLQMPLLRIRKTGNERGPVFLWMGATGKVTADEWPAISKYVDEGYTVLSFDPRGMGETRMPYKAISPDDPALAHLDFDQAYVSPLSSVLAGYGYNALLVGRPYILQTIEDAEIALRFWRAIAPGSAAVSVAGSGTGANLASLIAEALPDVKLASGATNEPFQWSKIVEQKTEMWPIEFLLPGGAYLH